MASRVGRFAAAGPGLLLCFCLCLPAIAASRGAQTEPSELHLRVGSFDPLTGQPPLPERLRLTAEPREGYFVVQFDRDVDQRLVDRLRAKGAETLHYLPDRAYLVRLPAGKKGEVRSEPSVRWLGPVEPGWKLSPGLGTRKFRDPARRADARLFATIDLFRGEDLDRVSRRIEALGIEVLHAVRFSDTSRLKVRATVDRLERAARIPAVAWIDEVGEIGLRNNDARWVIQTDAPGSTTVWLRGLHGEGQVVGHIDGPIYTKSCFFDDRSQAIPGATHRKLVGYRAFGGDGEPHGTHTAGTLAGDPSPINGSLNFAGQAYSAKISHTDLAGISGVGGSPSNLYDFLVLAHEDGARVHANSWGDDGTGDYTPLCRDVDLFSYDHEDALVVFSVSNERYIRSPENAKNALSVGASGNGALADDFCSGGSGPTSDGRRKPEIFAPGCGIDSAKNLAICGTASASGTSMAGPAVAAAGLLVRQYFEEGWYPTGTAQPGDASTPSGALMKAVLLNSAVDMAGIPEFPSDQEGWGRVLLEHALYFDGDSRKLVVLSDVRNALGLTTGVSDHLSLEVGGSTEPLKLTLVFTDPPAALFASSAAVNDLDLELVSPLGRVYRGNVFDSATGVSVPGGQADPINNVEMIYIPEPEPGEWRVNVAGTAVNQGGQGYALVATGQVEAGKGGSLRYAAYGVDDSQAMGNSDGIADPGETVTLSLSLLNLLAHPASSVSGRLFSSRFEMASVNSGLAPYPDIPPGAIAESAEPHYSLTISPGAQCGEVLPFRLRAGHETGSGESSFGLVVGKQTAGSGSFACNAFDCGADPVPADLGPWLNLVIEPGDDLRFSWPSAQGVAGYQLWRSADAEFGTAELVGFFTTTEFVETGGAAVPETWYYRVRAVNSCGWEGP
jgi:hypothetical protein